VLYAEFDDLEVLSPARAPGDGLPLCAVVRNEMYFLPAFLAHYRKVGVGHFVVVDDRSDDGSRDFLAGQPDVTLTGSRRRFGDLVVPSAGPNAGSEIRMAIVWRCLLPSRFAPRQWSVLADADEFVVLPPGVRLADVAGMADRLGTRCVTGVMLDVYPRRLEDFERQGAFDPNAEWFFDGERHLQLRKGRDPRVLYPGARARLMAELGIVRPKLKDRLNRLIGRRRYPRYNMLQKPFLRKWDPEDSLRDSHRSTIEPSDRLLLPLRHFKFNADSYRRIAEAIASGQHVGGSHEYVALDRVLAEMRGRGHPFLYARSRPSGDFATLVATGNAMIEPLDR
jgi:hypothetical protein